MGVVLNYLDTILVPLSLFITVGYHAFLWHNFKNNPSLTAIGINTLKKRQWLQGIKQGDDKKEMLAVQSLRNCLMEAILTASITILITISLAALANNAYKGSNLMMMMMGSGGSSSSSSSLTLLLFGSQSDRIIVLKYGSVSMFLLTSFLCSSIAIGYLVDANFLINASASASAMTSAAGDHIDHRGRRHATMILERGFLIGVGGSRVLCISLPLLLWFFGPVPVAFSSLAMVWVLYQLDYAATKPLTLALGLAHSTKSSNLLGSF